MRLPFEIDLTEKAYVVAGHRWITLLYVCGSTCKKGAKAAISNFIPWIAVHFSKTNIRCNAIAPGFFVTKQNEKLLFNEDETPTPRTGKILSATPMDRFGKTEEFIGTLLFLVHKDASSFVNGVVISVDGGFSVYSGV